MVILFKIDRLMHFSIFVALLILLWPANQFFAAEKPDDNIDYDRLSRYPVGKPGIDYAESIVDRDAIIDVGVKKQLFIDGMFIESSRGVQLTMNPPRQTGELLLTADQPWETAENAYIHCYASVLKEGDKIRLWYGVCGKYPNISICYAESTDGIHFSKPALNLHEVNGSTANNVVIPCPNKEGITLGGPAVWIDPKAPPDQMYKTQAKAYPKAIAGKFLHMYASPDGFNWKPMQVLNIASCDTQTNIFWDDTLRRYLMYTRLIKEPWVRMVRRIESHDLTRWGNEVVVLKADEVDRAARRGTTSSAAVDYYGGTVFKYPQSGGVYIMLAHAYCDWGLGRSVMDVRLSAGRDGKNFKRLGGRKPFLRLGPEGSFYSRMIYAMPNPIRMGDELWIYYTGCNYDHNFVVDPAAPGLRSGITRAVMRLDGFVSADADYAGGEIITPLITFQGDRLELNLDTSGRGSVLVELLDETGRPIDGFGAADATPTRGNSVRMPVSWGENGNVSRLAGKPIKIRFIMQDCKLYAFEFKK